MLQKLLSLRFRKKSVDNQDDLTRKERKDIEKQKLVKSDEENVEDFDDISFIVDYIGSDYVSEAQSVPLLMETLKRIKKQHTKTIRVDLVLRKGILKVTDNEQGALLITAPLYAIALCAQEQLRGFETVFALNITRRRIHLCHVFEGGSRLEVKKTLIHCFSFFVLFIFSRALENESETLINKSSVNKQRMCETRGYRKHGSKV